MGKKSRCMTRAAREKYLTKLAYDLAEKKLLDGTASSQLIHDLIVAGSQSEQLKQKRMKAEIKLADAKVASIKAAETSKELYEQAMSALKKYQGNMNG